MMGRIRGKDFFAIFWSVNSGVLSYGCWFLHQTGDYFFEGNYLKFNEMKNGNGIDLVPMQVNKSDFSRKEFRKMYNNTRQNGK